MAIRCAYIQYDLPATWGLGEDNVIAKGQVLELPDATYVHQIHLLYAGDGIDSQCDCLANEID